MLDIRLIRAEPDRVRASLEKRGENGAVIDELLRIDEERRARQTELETLKAEQNRLAVPGWERAVGIDGGMAGARPRRR